MQKSELSFSNKKAIIWDWNGTLLNDIDVCISCMNILLTKRDIPILFKEKYRDIFTFPVRKYYELAGFDFDSEPFDKPALEFITLYHQNLNRAELFPTVKNLLNQFQSRGFYQSVLSAMEHESLLMSLENTGIIDFFDEISGINDHYAHSKLDIGKDLLEKMNFRSDEIILIGDTLHDLEVANELGLDCLLIANGHQSKRRLLGKISFVLDDLNELNRVFQ